MRSALREAGRLDEGGVRVKLRMSVGVHSGECTFFVTRGDHRELLVTGPAATQVVRMEQAAATGQIVVSDDTAARLPAACTRPAAGPGRLLRSAPPGAGDPPPQRAWHPPGARLESALSPQLRAHLRAGAGAPEHRLVTVAFLRFGGVDGLMERAGPEAVADALDELVSRTADAGARHGVCLLGSDVDADGGKLLLTAGAPIASDDDDGRMLLALREILDGGGPLPVKIGVNRGAVFAGDIGPPYRRTYTVMGDAINLAARLMAAAPDGELYSTERVLDGSATRFAVTRMAPFRVKGKARPVEAFAVGPATGSRSREALLADRRFPLAGRRRELDALEAALTAVREGGGRVVEIVSEPGPRQEPAARGAAQPRERPPRAPRDLRGVHRRGTPRRVPPAAAPGAARPGRRGRRARSRAAADRGPRRLPDARAVAAAARDPVRGRHAADAGGRAARRGVPPRVKLHELVVDFLRATLPGAGGDRDRGRARDGSRIGGSAACRGGRRGHLALAAGHHAPRHRHRAAGARRRPRAPDRAGAADCRTRRSRWHARSRRTSRSRPACWSWPPSAREATRSTSATCCGRRPHDASHLPESIEAAAAARLDRLPPADRALVRRAAVLGRTFDPTLVPFVLDDDVPAPDAGTWARLHRYFEPDGEWYLRFRRQLVWEAAYASLPFRTRRRLHLRAGLELERRLGDDAAAVLALHFDRAGDHERTWRYARSAGDAALRGLAPTEGAAAYRRALEAGRILGAPAADRTQLWEALGDAYAQLGELARRTPRIRGGPAAGRRRARPPGGALPAPRRALGGGGPDPAGRTVGAARAPRPSTEPTTPAAPAARARLTAMLATLRQRQGRAAEAIALCEAAIGAAEATGEERAVAHACYVLDWALVESGRASEAGHSERALEIYRRLGDVGREAAVLNNAGGFAYRDGRWNDAMTLYLEGAEASARSGNAANAAFGDCNVGELLSDQGHWDEAESLLRRARQVWQATGYEWGVAYATAQLGRLSARAGREGQA